MSQGVPVRPIEIEDAAALARLMTLYRGAMSGGPVRDVSPESAEHLIQKAKAGAGIPLIGAEHQAALAGFALCYELTEIISGREAGQLDDLFVAPEARRAGLARALISHLTEIGARRQWTHLRWLVPKDNLPAKKLYDKVAQAAPWDSYRIEF